LQQHFFLCQQRLYTPLVAPVVVVCPIMPDTPRNNITMNAKKRLQFIE
jgi:hypothetical protein